MNHAFLPLAHRLHRSGDRWGVAAICIGVGVGVGQALAVVLENLTHGSEN
ncbi:hypothetical protein [Streptomyces sp. P9-A2]